MTENFQTQDAVGVPMRPFTADEMALINKLIALVGDRPLMMNVTLRGEFIVECNNGLFIGNTFLRKRKQE